MWHEIFIFIFKNCHSSSPRWLQPIKYLFSFLKILTSHHPVGCNPIESHRESILQHFKCRMPPGGRSQQNGMVYCDSNNSTNLTDDSKIHTEEHRSDLALNPTWSHTDALHAICRFYCIHFLDCQNYNHCSFLKRFTNCTKSNIFPTFFYVVPSRLQMTTTLKNTIFLIIFDTLDLGPEPTTNRTKRGWFRQGEPWLDEQAYSSCITD